MVSHACNSHTQETEEGGLVAWATQLVQGQPKLHDETLSQLQQQRQQKQEDEEGGLLPRGLLA